MPGAVRDSQKQSKTNHVQEDQVPLQCARQYRAPPPELIQSRGIDIRNQGINKEDRDQERNFGWPAETKKLRQLANIGARSIHFRQRHKSRREDDEVKEYTLES